MRVPGFLAAVVVAAMLVLPAVASADASLVAAYAFDEPTGTVATDASGYGNNGTISGATRVAGGKLGGALSFNGVIARVDIPDSNSLDLTTGMTLEAWVNPATLAGKWRTVLIKEQPAALAYALYAGEDNARPSAHAFTGSEFDTRGTSSLPLNAWSHLAATYDGATLRLYVNGTQVSSRAVSGAMVASSGALRIGGNAVWGEYFQGLIDEVRVYSRALSAAEIQSDMNKSAAADTQAPTAPTGVTATMNGLDVNVAWSASTDDTGVTRYVVRRSDNTIVSTPDASTLSAVDLRPPPGSFSYTVVAQDAAGNTSPVSAPASVTVPDVVPQVVITMPSEGATVSGSFNELRVAVLDDGGAKTIQYKLDGADYGSPIASPQPFERQFDVTSMPNGAHTLTAVVRDAAGQESTSPPVHIIVDNGAPRSVTITSPSNGSTVSGTIQLAMNAAGGLSSDRIGWRVDGKAVGTPLPATSPQPTWNTTALADGSHTVKVSVLADGVEVASDTVTVAVSNAAVPTPTPTPTPSGPVAAYGFDEASGTSATDGSGGGHPGTISGATRSAAGKFGGALSFDGINDLVTVPDANVFDLSTGMTLEAWVRPTTLNSSWRTVMLKEQPGALVYALYAGADNGRPSAHAFTSSEFDTRATSALPLNAWSHLAMTYDGANLRLFVNGTQVSSVAVTGAMVSSSGALRIGGNTIWGEYFKGLIDEVRVYNRALNASELQADAARAVSSG